MSDLMLSIDGMTFVYDSEKEAINKRKHGLSFWTAAFVFQDTLRLDFPDEMHRTINEERYLFSPAVFAPTVAAWRPS